MAGVSYHILEFPKWPLPHLEGIWIPGVQEFLSSINGSLQSANAFVQAPQHIGDQFLMDMILAQQTFSPKEIQHFNYCQLYLQVVTLADICNARGTNLAIGIQSGHYSDSQSQSTLHNPAQEGPGKQSWAIW